MTPFQKETVSIIKAAINNDPLLISDDFDFIKLFKFANKHKIIPLIYYKLSTCESFNNSEIKPLFLKAVYQGISISERQMQEIANLCVEFNKNNIDFMLLKGSELKKIYPEPEMRTMGDADILIKTEQYNNIKRILVNHGFEYVKESNCEIVWNKSGYLHLELHKRLFSQNNVDLYSFTGDGWDMAKKSSSYSNEHCLSAENNFIYLFLHFSKHYRTGGMGIRYIIDFYVFLKTYPDLDINYIKTELTKLKINVFFENILNLLNTWFNNGNTNDLTNFITNKIFEGEIFGKGDSVVFADALKMNALSNNNRNTRARKLISLIFPKFSIMSYKYPILKKMPFLMPFTYILRWINALFFKRSDIDKLYNNTKKINDSNLNSYKDELKYVGIDYYFTEED